MSRKAFQVQVDLDIQAVTCPGVWLCSNGNVSLQISMLDSCVQTASYKPIFPILCKEKFAFYKTFVTKHQLTELQRDLEDQWLYMELVQWQDDKNGNVLAWFQTTLDELLYPSTITGSIAGVDLDLLMEPTKIFPGTIAPKVEVSTKTTIEETLCVCNEPVSSTVIVNPKVLMSSQQKKKRIATKVCHSVEYSKHQKPSKRNKQRPIFCYRKAEDDLILRKPKCDFDEPTCCRQKKNLVNLKTYRQPMMSKDESCRCQCGHNESLCALCAKYSGYFDEDKTAKPRTNLFKESSRCLCCQPKAIVKTDFCDKKSCRCLSPKLSLAERLHTKLTMTLGSIPRMESPCNCNEDECGCCDCEIPTSRGELYRDLQRFYGDLYEKARSTINCVSTCQRL